MKMSLADAATAEADLSASRGETGTALFAYKEAADQYLATGSRRGCFKAGGVLGNAGRVLAGKGRVIEAIEHIAEEVRMKKKWCGGRADALSLAVSLHNYGELCLVAGEPTAARSALEESLYLVYKVTGGVTGPTPHATLSALARCHQALCPSSDLPLKFQSKAARYAPTPALQAKHLLLEATYGTEQHAKACRVKAERLIKKHKIPEDEWGAAPKSPQLFDGTEWSLKVTPKWKKERCEM